MSEQDRSGAPEPAEPINEPVAADSYEWLYSTEAGVEADGPAVAFETQQAAERWLSEHFTELLESGVTAVSLSDGSRIVYGPMPLEAG